MQMIKSTFGNELLSIARKYDENAFSIGKDFKVYDKDEKLCNKMSQFKVSERCNDFVDEIKEKHIKLISKFYNNNTFDFGKYGYTFDDLFYECVIFIMKSYDENRGAVSNFLTHVIRNILRKQFNKIQKMPITVKNLYTDELFYENDFPNFIFEDVKKIIKDESKYNMLVMRYRDGLHLKEIAKHYNVTVSWVQSCIQKNLKKIRKEIGQSLV